MQAFDECFDQTFALSSLSLLSLMQAFDERFDQTFKLADKKVCVCVCVCLCLCRMCGVRHGAGGCGLVACLCLR
jgi:hypothetical protein